MTNQAMSTNRGITVDDSGRLYAWDKREGQVIYRIPGHQHGDGSIDSDDSPVWILGSEADVEAAGFDIGDLPEADPDDA